MKRESYPDVTGNVEISTGDHGIFVGGDPEGLRSLASLLSWLADRDQNTIRNMPDGERDHTHLHPGCQLSNNSVETEICRLDAKGTGELPSDYEPAQQSPGV